MTFFMKNSVLDNFPPCPPAHPPLLLKSVNFVFIVVSLSLREKHYGNSKTLRTVLRNTC